MKYDYKKIGKTFKELKTPNGYLNPCKIPWDSANWFPIFSKRNEGKTTNLLLWGMCQRKHYNTAICYVRATSDDIRPMIVGSMMNVIIECGYIEKLTDGVYNNCYLKNKKWFYSYVNPETQQIEKVDDTPFMYILSIDQWLSYKSGLNVPNGDLIILDEFVQRNHSITEFVDFNQLISTIRRSRDTVKIVLLGNTITPHDLYFNELGIEKIVLEMKENDTKNITTSLGTPVFIWYFSRENNTIAKESRRVLDNLYHGFKGMNTILGDGWEVQNYPHITSEMHNDEVLIRACIDCGITLLKLDIRVNEEIGIYATVQPTNRREGDIIFTNGIISQDNEIGGIGATANQRKLFAFHKIGRCYFATNDIGELFETYIKDSTQISRKKGF